MHPRSLLILSVLAFWPGRPAVADVIWKVVDEGPRAPDVRLILGDDSRTLAFTGGDAFEFDGTNWHPVELNTTAVVGSAAWIFFSGGRFVATTVQDRQLLIFILKGNDWTRIASGPWTSQSLIPANDRIFVPAESFNSNCVTSQTCPTDRGDSHGLLSISLVDGSIRQEPPMPSCYGNLFTLSGQLYLIQDSPPCGGPSSKAGGRTAYASSALPFFRLDGDHWTSLPAWDLPTDALFSTPNSLWSFFRVSPAGSVVRVFTAAGLSDPIALPPDVDWFWPGLIPLERGNRLLLVSRLRSGSIYELQNGNFVRMTPESPITAAASFPQAQVFAAGNRLFTAADGWNVYVRGPSTWTETFGISGSAGADSYLMGTTKTFALRGATLFRRDADTWTRISPPPRPKASTLEAIWQDRPVVVDESTFPRYALLAHDPTSDSWEDMHVPDGFGPGPMLASGEDLFVAGYPGTLARFHGSAWSVATASPPAGTYESDPVRVREANGSIYVIGNIARRLDGDHLTAAFTDLDPRIIVDDIAAIGGQLFLLVTDGSRSDELHAVIVTLSGSGYQTRVTEDDIDWTGAYFSLPGTPLAVVGDTLLFVGLSLVNGQLRAQRGAVVPAAIDPQGRFGASDIGSYGRGPLYVPSSRVRKNLAAVADVTGFGGVRYRSTLTVANFSAISSSVARIFAGASTTPVLEASLGPGIQTRIEDPVPGFVGPLAVEFDGLTDERDAWAGVRVWSPSDGGTAGTSIVASNPGDLPFRTALLPPAMSPGTRTHVALSASADGPRQGITVVDYRARLSSDSPYTAIASGGFLQVTPSADYLAAPLGVMAMGDTIFPLPARDDLLGYIVRNEAGTNDGTIVPFEPPDTLPGRRTRFLPAVVATTSQFGQYRTELSLGWRTLSNYPPARLDFSATYRDAAVSWSFPFSIGQGEILSLEDVGSWLAGNGVPLNPSDFVGTLTFSSDRPEGAADLLVTAVVLARGPGSSGDYGVSVPVINEVQWAENEAIVPGLREDAAFRSNVAVANPEPDGGASVTLSVSLRRASDGAAVGSLAPVTLAPGQRFQFNRVLRTASYSGDAYAVVSRVSGAGRFVAYGVMNDNVTGDGTLFPMTRAE